MKDENDKLTTYIPAHAMQLTNGDDGNETFDSALLCEITEKTDDEIELAFDLSRPTRRTYIRFKVRDLVAELERTP